MANAPTRTILRFTTKDAPPQPAASPIWHTLLDSVPDRYLVRFLDVLAATAGTEADDAYDHVSDLLEQRQAYRKQLRISEGKR